VTIPLEAIRGAYDAIAPAYAERFRDELDHKPLDRAMLDVFAERVRGLGIVADVGTGPGQVARHLHRLGVEVVGVDLSPAMVAEARRLSAGLPIPFRVGNLLALDVPDGSLAGVTAFHAHVHVPPHQLVGAFAELHRVLRPGAPALLSFHVGDERLELAEWFERPVRLEFHFFPWPAVLAALREASLTVEARLERTPYTPLEHPSTRGYVLARRD
jgi:SAM-dependent methyltransferase